jgi:hypothetical protein
MLPYVELPYMLNPPGPWNLEGSKSQHVQVCVVQSPLGKSQPSGKVCMRFLLETMSPAGRFLKDSGLRRPQ